MSLSSCCGPRGDGNRLCRAQAAAVCLGPPSAAPRQERGPASHSPTRARRHASPPAQPPSPARPPLRCTPAGTSRCARSRRQRFCSHGGTRGEAVGGRQLLQRTSHALPILPAPPLSPRCPRGVPPPPPPPPTHTTLLTCPHQPPSAGRNPQSGHLHTVGCRGGGATGGGSVGRHGGERWLA